MMDSFIVDIQRVRDTLSSEPASAHASQPAAAPPARSDPVFDASAGMTQPATGAYADQATGSTPPPEEYVHKGIWCDSCNNKVVGIRHKCLDCYNFDLCNPCITTSDVQSTHADMPHTFEAIHPPRSKTPVPTPSGSQPPVANDSQTGQQCLCSLLPRPLGCYICNPRGMTGANPGRPVSYKCDSCQTTINSTRHKCMVCADFDLCDACYTDGFAVADHSLVHMFMHIEDPIRVITAPAVRQESVEPLCAGCSHEGPRYKCDSCGAVDLCMSCLGEVERATINHAAFHAEQGWNQPVRFVPYHKDPESTSPAPARAPSTRPPSVHSAACDACDSTIVGTRHKCTSCEDFDLCDACHNARVEILDHKADHEMLHLELPTRVVTHIVPFNEDGTSSARPSPLGSGSPTVVHRAWCDGCSERIRGVRHKCLDCSDFDFCDSCIGKEHFNGQHEFYALVEAGEVIVRNVSEVPSRPLAVPQAVPTVRVRGQSNPQVVRSRPSVPMPPAPAPVPTHFPVRNGRSGRATQPARHPAACDMCSSHILGVRYKCTNCPDYDVCESCFRISDEVHPGHSFVKVHKREDIVTRKTPQARLRHHARCDVCQEQIMGIRYKCIHPACPDFDICSRCEAMPIPVHPDTHAFVKLRSHVSHYDGLHALFSYVSSGQIRQRGQASPTIAPVPTPVSTLPLPAPVPVVRIPTPRVQIPGPITSTEAFHTAAPSPVVPFSTLGTTIVPHTTIVASLPHTPTPEFIPSPALSRPTIPSPALSPPAIPSPVLSQASLPSPPPIPPMLAQAHGIEKFFDSWSAASSSAKLDEHVMHHSDMYKPSYEAPSVAAPVPVPEPVVISEPSPSEVSATRARQLEAKRAKLRQLKEAREQRMRSQTSLSSASSEQEISALMTISRPVTVAEEQDPDAPMMSLMASARPVSFPIESTAESVVDDTEVAAVRESIEAVDDVEVASSVGGYRHPSPSLESVSDATTPAVVVTPEQIETPQRIASPLPVEESGDELPALVPSYPSSGFDLSPPMISIALAADRLVAHAASVASAASTPSLDASILSATFVEDRSIVDGQMVSGGAEFAKCWRMRNDGTSAWPQGTTISFVGGHSMLIEPDMVHWNVTGDLAPGNEIDVEVEMKAPEEPGRYVSYWRLKTPEGEAFGARVWCDIIVAELERAGSSGSSEVSASSIVIPTHAPSMSAASVSPSIHSMPTTMHATSESEADTLDLESVGSFDSDDSVVWAEVRRQGLAERSQGGDGFEVVYDSD